MTVMETAKAFFEACETGRGWQGCARYCSDSAGFAAQAEALKEISDLAGYCDWMRDVYEHLNDISYEVKGFAVDPDRDAVLAYGAFRATTKGDAPQALAEDYVYAMQFRDGRISHVTKIWNDLFTA